MRPRPFVLLVLVVLAVLAAAVGAARAEALSLAAPATIPMGAPVYAAAPVDVNGDKHVDLVTADSEAHALGLLLGNGDGTFRPKTDIALGDDPYFVTSADLNGDGKADLVTGNVYNFSVSVLLGNGDGTFQAAHDYATPEGPFVITVVDVNADKRLDLEVADVLSDHVSVLLGNGDGTFQPRTDYVTGDLPYGVVTVDLNGDGHVDLATENADDSSVSIFLGNGDGTFRPRTDFPAGSHPYSFAAADFDHDGHVDLATADSGADTVTVLLGHGDGTFGLGKQYKTASGPFGITAADLDCDGDADLVTGSGLNGAGSVLLGNGDGTFGPHADTQLGQSLYLPVVGDLNGDRKPDIVSCDMAGGAVSIQLNTMCAITPSVVGGETGHGKISPDAWRLADPGATPAFSFTPDSGYKIAEVDVDGRPVEPTGSGTYTFPPLGADHAISVKFVALVGPSAQVSGWQPGWHKQPVTLAFTGVAVSGGSAVDHTEYRLGDGVWTSGSTVGVTAQGVTQVHYRAVDVDGIAGAVRRCFARVDTRLPHVAARAASGRTRATLRLRYRVSDPVPGCGHAVVHLAVLDAAGRVLTRSSTRQTTTNAWHTVDVSTHSLAPGVYSVALYAVDLAGNHQRGTTATELTVR